MGVLVFLVLGATLLRGLERLFPARDAANAPLRTRLFARERLTDIAHIVFNQAVTQPFVKALGMLTFLTFVVVFQLPRDAAHLTSVWHREARLAGLPVVVQAPLAILFVDLVGYWVHRAFHYGELWRFHAVHHSSRTLDWLAGVRNHPIAEGMSTVASAIPLLLIGFDPRVLSILAPLGLYAILLHANVSWGTSFVRYVFVTPLFHRWHHAHPDALPASRRHGVNFAGLLPIWDLLFGTFYAPRIQPVAFGADVDVPPRFLSQLAFPFQHPKTSPQVARLALPAGQPWPRPPHPFLEIGRPTRIR
jgi:sterol desaturase/sphingolipid hydroxylase (fatty acid hydroxylase superfamily)